LEPQHARKKRQRLSESKLKTKNLFVELPENEKTARQLGGLFFQGRIVPTEVRINPSELSGEILWVAERQCQGISLQ
jgi:hypothetical protein